jgi:hypothetical protein
MQEGMREIRKIEVRRQKIEGKIFSRKVRKVRKESSMLLRNRNLTNIQVIVLDFMKPMMLVL